MAKKAWSRTRKSQVLSKDLNSITSSWTRLKGFVDQLMSFLNPETNTERSLLIVIGYIGHRNFVLLVGTSYITLICLRFSRVYYLTVGVGAYANGFLGVERGC